MAARYDLIKCINAGPAHKVSGMKAPIEMVVLDEEGDTIQCTVKDIFVPIFEGLLAEGNVYVVTNFGVALNTIKFKPTRHEFRIHFKRDTIVRPVQDSLVPLNGFNFVPFKTIQSESKEDGYLVGVMGVSNTNYNSKLFINVEFPAARDFFARVNKLDPVDGQGIMPLVCDQPVSDEEDFLRLSVYKTVAEIKEHNQYKGCKKCRRGLRELEKKYLCPNCIRDYGFYEPRYIIHIRVIDHTDAASFVLFDGEAAKFLGVSAKDLRQSCVTKGVEKNSCPEEINKLRDIKFIFKVQLKMRNLNSYEPYVIHVLRMTNENSLVSTFLDKYNLDTACESEPTPSPAVDEKHNSKILGAKKHIEEIGEESVSSKSKKGKWVVVED
ncbi:Putative PIF1 DNA helicase/replication protein-like protein [Arachis hypogaea]|nr:Putative PIF1 DNA helicase/replication protein-like protein [Arachis hypogaea]